MPTTSEQRLTQLWGFRLLKLDSDSLEEDLRYVREHGLDGVVCNSVHGFNGSDFRLLKGTRFNFLYVVEPLRPEPDVVEPMRWLRALSLGAGGAFDLRGHDALEYLATEVHPGLRLPAEMPSLETLRLWKDKPKTRDLTLLPQAPALTWLSTIQANITSLRGIERFPRLRKLTLAYLRSLTDITALGELPNLEELEIQSCPHVVDLSALRGATNLRKLVINQSKPINSIGFVRDLPSLQHLGLCDTDVTDGDMSPCIGIGWVGFMDRPHLSHKLRDVREETRRLGKTLPPLTSPVG